MNYSTFSWERHAIAGDDGYVDELARLGEALLTGQAGTAEAAARAVTQRRWPCPLLPVPLPANPASNGGRTSTPSATTCALVLERDRFVCRYCGTRTVAGEVLDAMHVAGLQFGDLVPCHRNWKMTETHPAYWWQYATFEHVVPVSRGGHRDDADNVVIACWPCQSRKGTYLLDELGWALLPVSRNSWDGLRSLLTRLTDAAHVDRAHGFKQPRVAVGKEASGLSGHWVVISFHPTCDGRQGALVAAARHENLAAMDCTSRGAMRSRAVSPRGPYVSRDGRWRTRCIDATHPLARHPSWTDARPWVLERLQ